MVRRIGKTFFSESDDENLIKYIAKVKPTNSGRQGNNMYISLEESERPWAKRHSWQSWRERYRKNQDWFNYQIKQYQKKLKKSATEEKTDDRGELYEELFGVSQISEDDGDEADVHKESLDPSSFDDVVKTETAPILPLVEGPASKPVISSEQELSAAATATALKPPHVSEDSGDESDVHKRLLPPPFDDVMKIETDPPSQELTSKPSEQKSSNAAAATALKPPQVPKAGGDESDAHERLLAPSSFDDVVKIKIVPPVQEPTSKPSEQKSFDATTPIALKSPRYIRTRLKKIASRDDDSNFFGTPPLSPSPSLPAANSTTPRGDPPTLTQGFYRSSFKRPRAAFGNVTNDESWPPKRRKKMAKDSDDRPDVEMPDAFGGVKMNKAVFASLPVAGSTNGPSRVRPPAQMNAVASSSKVLLSDPPHRPAKPTNLLKVIYTKGNPSSNTNHVHTDAPSLPKKAIQDTNLALVKKNHESGVAGSSSRKPVPIKSMQRLISSPDDDVDHQLACLPSVDTDDPFIANKHNTPTSHVRNFMFPPRRIDLRKSLDNGTRRRRSRTSTTTTSSISRQSNPSFLLPEDREIINQVGLQKVMAVIAKNYGFDVDVAMKAFFATKSIEKTKSLLQFAKEVTNSATSALLSKLVNDDDIDSFDDDDDDEPQYMRHGHNDSSLPSRKDHQRSDALTNSGRQKPKRSSGGSRRKSNQLNIKPRSFDEEIDEMALSDYSPPRVSRAGQFLRLVKEGRREEAVDRERRRVSGAFVAQTQTQAQRYDGEDQPQQSSLSSSPTHNSQHALDNIVTRNVEPPIVTPYEDVVVQQHHDQPPDDSNISLPAVDADDVDEQQHHHRIFLKRISEGQSSLNEDEDDPEVLKLAQEHRDLVMNVMEDNADALRSFEQKHNQDLLRLWSLDWVRRKIADM